MSVFSYTKLDAGILRSSVWVGTPSSHKLAWIALLAMKDVLGRVTCSVQGLAREAEITREEAQAALDSFMAPDPDSRTPDFEGRRIEKRDGIYYILNHDKYRDQQDEDYTRARKARNKADQRARERAAAAADVSPENGDSHQMSPHTDTYSDNSGGGGGGENSPYGTSASPQQPPAAAEASNLTKTFGGISPRIRQLADVLGQHLRVSQDMDFTSIELKHVPVIEEAPEELVALTVKYVLFGKNDYWRDLMMDENDGAGGLKLLIRAFAKISEQAKSRGSSTKPKSTLNAQRGAGKRKTQVNLKAESVVPRPEDLILEAEELL